MRIAYLVNQYPKTSHSFIRREIAALEELGLTVSRYTLRRTSEAMPDSADRSELEKTEAVIVRPYLRRAMSALETIARNPSQFVRMLLLAVTFARSSDRTVVVHLIYLLEAAVVANWCRRDNIDHLHVHFGTNSATVGMFINGLIGIPWSFTVHGPEEFDRPLGLVLSEKIARARFVIAVSSFGRAQLWRWINHEEWKKVNIIRCGLDAMYLTGAILPNRASTRLVCVGRLSEQKGQLLLVEAAKVLKAKNISFEIVLAGDGPMRTELERTINAAGLQNSVWITGWISNQQVRREIENARALVLPSFAEGLPVAIMEAMALERPVLSTLVAGIPELVVHDENGWLVPAGDVTALANTLIDVLKQSQATLAMMGANARQKVLAQHNAIVEATKLKLLFEGRGG